MTDLSIDKLFYLPNMDYEIGLFLKYIISYIASKEIMIDFKNIIIKPDNGCCNIHIFKNRNKDELFCLLPNNLNIEFKLHLVSNKITNENWYKFLIKLKNLSSYHYPKIYYMISEYIKEEFSNVQKSIDDYKYLKKKIKHSYFLDPWFKFNYTLEYKNISNQKKNISVIISNLKKISNQVSTEETKKNIENYIAGVIVSYCDKINDCIVNNDIDEIESLFVLIKRKIIKTIDSNFKFIKTVNVNFRNLFLSFYEFYNFCVKVDFDIQKNIHKLNLIFQLSYEKEIFDYSLNYKINNKLKKNINFNNLNTYHPILRTREILLK